MLFKRLSAKFLRGSLFALFFSIVSNVYAYEGEELGYIDRVTVNGRHFDDLDEQRITFYKEDLRSSRVTFMGLLEAEDRSVDVDDLSVEISLDGGYSWDRASGNDRWRYSFKPDIGKTYEFSIRVVKNEVVLTKNLIFNSLGGFKVPVFYTVDKQGNEIYELDRDSFDGSQVIDNFADINIESIELKYQGKDYYVELDGNLSPNHPQLSAGSSIPACKNCGPKKTISKSKTKAKKKAGPSTSVQNPSNKVADSINFSGLKLFKNKMIIPQLVSGWHEVLGNYNLGGSLASLKLTHWGLGEEKNLLWYGWKGTSSTNNAMGQASLDHTVKIYANGEIETSSSNLRGTVYGFGDLFEIITEIAPINGRLNGLARLRSKLPFPWLPDFLIDADGHLDIEINLDGIGIERPRNSADWIISPDVSIDLDLDGLFEYDLPGDNFLNIDQLSVGFEGFNVGGSFNINVDSGFYSFLDGLELDFDGLLIDLQGPRGSINFSQRWRNPFVIPIIDYTDTRLELRRLIFDYDFESPDVFPINITRFDADIRTNQRIFRVVNPSVSYQNERLNFTFDEAYMIDMDKFRLKNVEGHIDLSDGNRHFAASTSQLEINLGVGRVLINGENVKINSSGIDGEFSLVTDDMELDDFGFNTKLTELAVTLDNSRLVDSSLKAQISISQFNNLKVGLTGVLTEDGLQELSIDSNAGPFSQEIDGFGTFTVRNISIGGNLANRTHYINFDPDFQLDNSMLPEMPNLSFEGVKLYPNGRIDMRRMGLSYAPDDADISFGPLDISLNNFDLNYRSGKWGLGLSGNAAFGALFGGGVSLSIDQSGEVDFEGMEIDFNEAGIGMQGLLELSGGGFHADVDLSLIDMFTFEGELALGSQGRGRNAFSYWLARIQMSQMIPLSPIPLAIYEIGGGLAYHMRTDYDSPEVGMPEFVPDDDTLITFVAGSKIGTSFDRGYTWHGDFLMTIDTNLNFSLAGDSYLLSEFGEEPRDRRLSTEIRVGASPNPYFSLLVDLEFAEDIAGMEIYEVAGTADILFASNDWHIYIGTEEAPTSLTLFDVIEGQGYVMVDSRGMAFGVSTSFDKRASAGPFWGRIEGGAEFDFKANTKPFFIDARGRLWIGLEAGVSDWEIFSARASLSLRVRAPDPTFVKARAEMRYSVAGGLVSGNYGVTFWLVGDSDDEAAAEELGMPLITTLYPDHGDEDVTRNFKIDMTTSMPIDSPFQMEGDIYVLRLQNPVNNEYIDTRFPDYVYNAVQVRRTNAPARSRERLIGGMAGNNSLSFGLYGRAGRNAPYELRAKASLLKFKERYSLYDALFMGWQDMPFENVFEEVEYDEPVKIKRFRTTRNEGMLRFEELISNTYPNRFSDPVPQDTQLYIQYKTMENCMRFGADYRHTVEDNFGNVIVRGHPWVRKIAYEDESHATEQPILISPGGHRLRPTLFYRDLHTGEVRMALGGINPFENDQENEQESSVDTPAANTLIGRLAQNAGIERNNNANLIGARQVNQRQYQGDAVEQEIEEIVQRVDTMRYESFYDTKFHFKIRNEDGIVVFEEPFDVLPTEYSSTRAMLAASEASVNRRNLLNGVLFGGTAQINRTNHMNLREWERDYADFQDSTLRRFLMGMYRDFPNGEPPHRQAERFRLQFDDILICPEVARLHREFLRNNPRPIIVGGHNFLNFMFETLEPLCWEQLEFEFRLYMKKHYPPRTDDQGIPLKSEYGPSGGPFVLGPGDYQILPTPYENKYVIAVDMNNILGDEIDFYEYARYYYRRVIQNGQQVREGDPRAEFTTTVTLYQKTINEYGGDERARAVMDTRATRASWTFNFFDLTEDQLF